MSGPVGFIGLGNIGAPMARRLVDSPDGLVVFDLRTESTEPFVELGAATAGSPAELASVADRICVVVQSEQQVRDVLFGADGLAQAGQDLVVAVHSTISAEGAESIATDAAGRGIAIVDAPVSGGAKGAHEGTLAAMVGGEDAAVERIRPVLEQMASMVHHMGPVGAGTRTKIARNLIAFASFAAVGEAQRLADEACLDLSKLGAVVRHSDAVTGGPGAIMLRQTSDVMPSDDGLRAIFEHTATLGLKDLELAQQLGSDIGVATPFAALASERLRSALGLEHEPT